MRNRCSLLTLLLGCNQIYGLDKTQPIDAAYFDAPPATCPALGTPPVFGQDFQQVVFQPCSDYTLSSSGRALARCNRVISEGPIGGALVGAVGLEQTADLTYDHPRLHPDGQSVVVRMIDRTVPRTSFGVFARTDAGWGKTSEFSVPYQMLGSSTPSRDNHVLVVASGGGLRELADDGAGTWNEVLVHDFAELGITSLGDQVDLSADGLRLIFIGTAIGKSSVNLLYADRAAETERFSTATPMPSVEYLPNGFLTEDCGRLYFSGLGTVFYVESVR
ncbi:MAG TPA: hypothetical protein VLB44_17835 [Kofleriaceae bacterium]|nr:hypothetical protein [Kofleriaceae bacterium]